LAKELNGIDALMILYLCAYFYNYVYYVLFREYIG